MQCNKCPMKLKCSDSPRQKKRGLLGFFRKKKETTTAESVKMTQIALVGMPNVGKSVLFNGLTGTYVTVSNYPGTTVEVSRGQTSIGDLPVAVVDTPGMYSLLPITEEEKVARDLLLFQSFDVVIHVVDAKNLGRMLPLTFQLIEAGLPSILAINMMDEAQQLGIEINPEYLERELGIPVVTMAAAANFGVNELKARVAEYVSSNCLSRSY